MRRLLLGVLEWFRDFGGPRYGAADIIHLDNNCSFVDCELDNTTGMGIDTDGPTLVERCHLHNISEETREPDKTLFLAALTGWRGK